MVRKRDSGMTKTGTIACAALALALTLLLCGCAQKQATTEIFAMDTVMQLTAYGSGAERALGVAEGELARLDAELSAQAAHARTRRCCAFWRARLKLQNARTAHMTRRCIL